MKFRVTMKDPDTLYDACDEAAAKSAAEIPGLTEHERAEIAALRRVEYRTKAGKWFDYGEYLTVEIDTEAGTCVVVPL